MPGASRTIRWSALTCTLNDIDLYFGLAAGLDDVLARQISRKQFIAHPFEHIRIADGDNQTIPLRIYSVRDPSIVQIHPTDGGSVPDGFKRVRLVFPLDGNEVKGQRIPAGDTDISDPVMAFMLTIGLDPEVEDEFYHRLVTEFLSSSWVTMPRLVKELGCEDPHAAMHG